jgi:hypothetical protein
MRVININIHGGEACHCGNWLEHWRKFGGGEVPMYCPEKKCTNAPEMGALVQMENSADTHWYVIPLCKTHNAETGRAIEINDHTELVPADVKETCNKPLAPRAGVWRSQIRGN